MDNYLKLDVPQGTFAKNRNGVSLYSITVKTLGKPPEVPENMEMLGHAYELIPAGASFDPPLTLTIKYDISEIPEGVYESNLFVAKWMESSRKWIELESTVDTTSQTVSTEINGFSIHAIMASTLPASFTLTDLSVNPAAIEVGNSVSISIILANTGDLTGVYEVNLMIDDVLARVQEVTLNGGDSETISFSVTPDTVGEHTVNISGLLGTFKVKEPKPLPAPAVAPAPASFTISDLWVTPSEVKPAEQVTISALVINTGGSEASYTVVLKIDAAEEDKKEVIVGVGKSETVTFTIAKDTEGIYVVNIDGKVGQFTVVVPPPPTLTSWWLTSGIIACCVVVVGLLVYFFVWRKRGAPRPS